MPNHTKDKVICSIVIVNWNATDYLTECVRSIQENTRCTHEIIVVDNDSFHEEREKIKLIPGISLIYNNKNMGFAAANNQGIQKAQGDYLFLLNPDTILINDAIDRMIVFLQLNENVHAIGPKLYYSDKHDYHPSIKSLDSPLHNLFLLIPGSLHINNVYHFFINKLDRIQKVNCIIGAAMLFRRAVFDRLGLLDEQFFMYGEEVDFFMRMKRAGLSSAYFPQAKVIHYGGKSQQKSSIAKLKYLWSSKIKYFDKYFSTWNVKISLTMMYIILKTKIILFDKNELGQVCDLIKKKLNEKIVSNNYGDKPTCQHNKNNHKLKP